MNYILTIIAVPKDRPYIYKSDLSFTGSQPATNLQLELVQIAINHCLVEHDM